MKHGTPLLDITIADIYNAAFEKHEDLNINGEVLIAIQKHEDLNINGGVLIAIQKHEDLNINGGVLIAIQKPGKKKGLPGNLRPITLLNLLGKALSIVILNRIGPQVKEYLSKNQSVFGPDRSTADVIWTHRWQAAKALKEETTIKISGIDMSAAFDTINRRHLLDIVKLIIDKDEHRQIHILLSGRVIDTRINGTFPSKPFTSNVGNP